VANFFTDIFVWVNAHGQNGHTSCKLGDLESLSPLYNWANTKYCAMHEVNASDYNVEDDWLLASSPSSALQSTKMAFSVLLEIDFRPESRKSAPHHWLVNNTVIIMGGASVLYPWTCGWKGEHVISWLYRPWENIETIWCCHSSGWVVIGEVRETNDGRTSPSLHYTTHFFVYPLSEL
jgi:hypothetical protein